jgi:selenocysteine-specific elongation factor
VKTTPVFDAALDFPVGGPGRAVRGTASFPLGKVRASFTDYGFPGRKSAPLVRVVAFGPVEVRWGDGFEVLDANGDVLGRGLCLHPQAPSPEELKPARRKALLERLSKGEEAMLLALAETGGVKGVREEEVAAFCRLDASRIEALARALEEQGQVRILNFSPLFIVSQGALDFLEERIAVYLAQFHKTHPGRKGAPVERIEKRFGAPRSVLLLALRALGKAGRVGAEDGLAWLADFRIPLSAADEKVLGELEEMFLKGEFGATTIEEIKARFRLRPGKLETLLSVLTERKTIVEGRDGYILHSRWLDELVARVRGSGKRELSVADFKAMTGLTRKYAIPLLELLDEMGITRRRGSSREILRSD